MLNEDKIRIMSRCAMYEKAKGKEDIRIHHYFQSDYIVFNVIKTVISATVAYGIILAIACVLSIQYFMENIHKISIEQLAGRVIFGYILVLAVYLTISLVVYTKRYAAAKKSVKKYHNQLKKLSAYYNDKE